MVDKCLATFLKFEEVPLLLGGRVGEAFEEEKKPDFSESLCRVVLRRVVHCHHFLGVRVLFEVRQPLIA